MFRCSRQMSSAALHPLTFRHNTAFLIDAWGAGVILSGPRTIFSSCERMQRALQSRLLRSFRIMNLIESGSLLLHELLVNLQSDNAPVLHALTLQSRAQNPPNS